MNKKNKKKYYIAIYTIILCLSVIFCLVGFEMDENNNWQSVLINLSTELLGVVLVFFLVNYLFSIDDWNLSERIQKLLISLENPKKLSAEQFFKKSPNIEHYIKNSKSIDLLGFSLTNVLNKYVATLRDNINDGVKIRIILSDPDSLAPKVAALSSDIPNNIEYFKKRLRSSLGTMEYLLRQDAIEKNIDIKLLPFPPHFAYYCFTDNKENSSVFIEMYAHKSGYGNHPWFSLSKDEDYNLYNYFANQFENLWEYAENYTENNRA